jgi:hypothetical protein
MATDGLLLFWSDFSTSRAGWGTALRWRESSLPWRDWTTLVLEVLIKFINLREVQISKPSFSSICFNWYSLSLSLSLFRHAVQLLSPASIVAKMNGREEIRKVTIVSIRHRLLFVIEFTLRMFFSIKLTCFPLLLFLLAGSTYRPTSRKYVHYISMPSHRPSCFRISRRSTFHDFSSFSEL